MLEEITSKTIFFKLADIDDAEFILELRTNATYNKHLSITKASLMDQRHWLKDYKLREKDNKEYYFIIYRKDSNERIGTVRLYDFIDNKKSFCWGSWILNERKTASSALESALLVYKVGFYSLGFEQSHFDVRKDNDKVIAFHKKMGAVETSKNDIDVFFNYTKEKFEERIVSFKKYLG